MRMSLERKAQIADDAMCEWADQGMPMGVFKMRGGLRASVCEISLHCGKYMRTWVKGKFGFKRDKEGRPTDKVKAREFCYYVKSGRQDEG